MDVFNDYASFLKTKKVDVLRNEASNRGIKGYGLMKKHLLIDALVDYEYSNNSHMQEPIPDVPKKPKVKQLSIDELPQVDNVELKRGRKTKQPKQDIEDQQPKQEEEQKPKQEEEKKPKKNRKRKVEDIPQEQEQDNNEIPHSYSSSLKDRIREMMNNNLEE